MELNHANQGLVDIQQIPLFTQWDAVSGLGFTYKDNDFELLLPEEVWAANPVLENHFVYEPGTEWGGRVEGIGHSGEDIRLIGPTWRGMLARKIIYPPAGEAYLTITNMDANSAISVLMGSTVGELFIVSSLVTGITVSGQFRYTNLLDGLQYMLRESGARLVVAFKDGKVVLSAETISILSEELSQDFSVPIASEHSSTEAYNHVIALGAGEGTNRLVIELYRTDDGIITQGWESVDGQISSVPVPTGLSDKQLVLDLPNIEVWDELYREAYLKLLECVPTSKISIDMTEVYNLSLGDIVCGRDYVTGLSIVDQVVQVIRTVNSTETTRYKMGGD